MKQYLKKWQNRLKLKDWFIYLIKVKQSDLKKNWCLNVNADNMYNEKSKVAFIRYVKTGERSLIHELLHLVYLDESETKIEKRTVKIVKGLKNF